MRIHLENRSGYDTRDLLRFLRAGVKACGLGRQERSRSLEVVVLSAPRRHPQLAKGCAEIGGTRMVLAIAPPSPGLTPPKLLRRLACLFRHEAAHIRGIDHDDMPEPLLYSLGPLPGWARGLRLRYRGRRGAATAPLYDPRHPYEAPCPRPRTLSRRTQRI